MGTTTPVSPRQRVLTGAMGPTASTLRLVRAEVGVELVPLSIQRSIASSANKEAAPVVARAASLAEERLVAACPVLSFGQLRPESVHASRRWRWGVVRLKLLSGHPARRPRV